MVWAAPATSGTVTNVSVTSVPSFMTGAFADGSTTPALTLTFGLLPLANITTGSSSGQVLTWDGTSVVWAAPATVVLLQMFLLLLCLVL